MRNKKRGIVILILVATLIFTLTICGCIGARGQIIPGVTLAPSPSPTPEPTPSPLPSPSPSPNRYFDLLGNAVQGVEHFEQYITFSDIQVYEQFNDTFVDLKAANAYPAPLRMALKITFHDDNGDEIASAMLQAQNGQYAITLPAGTSMLYAQVDTDMPVTDLDFEIEFDNSLSVIPEGW